MLASMILPLVRSLSSPTYYFRVGADQPGCAPVQNFDDGYAYGPCGQGNKYGAHSKYWAANYNAKEHCGKPITLDYNGKKMVLTVADECPGCAADNHVDMGLEALIELTGSAEAACAINRLPVKVSWSFGSYVSSGAVKSCFNIRGFHVIFSHVGSVLLQTKQTQNDYAIFSISQNKSSYSRRCYSSNHSGFQPYSIDIINYSYVAGLEFWRIFPKTIFC
jgi:hypothetical protein